MCIDLPGAVRADREKKNRFTMLRIDSLLEILTGGESISSLDLEGATLQVRVSREEKFSFDRLCHAAVGL